MTLLRHGARPGLREVVAVWGIWGVVSAEIFATYSRLPVRDLYHVSSDGRGAAAGRALVLLNWPIGLVAIAIAAIVAADARSRTVSALAVAAVALCAALTWPGVVDQADLDAKWANAIPAAGVLLALVLTAWTARAGLGPASRSSGDRARIVAAAALLILSIPWLAADLGYFVLGSNEWWAGFGHARLHPKVHVGHHHGMDGTLLALSAIVLSRTLGRLGPRLRRALGIYLAVLLVYGLANMAQDFWLEQLVKRGVTTVSLPSMLLPSLSLGWLILLLVAAAMYLLLFRRPQRERLVSRPLRWPAAAVIPIVVLVVIGLVHGPQKHETPLGYVSGIAFALAPKGTSHLFNVQPSGLFQLTDGGDNTDLAPAWSPDGKSIAFQSNRDGNWEVYVMNADGSHVRRLTHDDARDGEPGWSANGQHIFFVRDGDLYGMRIDGRGLRKLADDPHWPRPAVSPGAVAAQCLDGGHWHICIDGRPITHGASDDFAPTWSPDGKRIAFISDRDGNDQLFVMRADGTSVVRITSGQSDKDTPAWRP